MADVGHALHVAGIVALLLVLSLLLRRALIDGWPSIVRVAGGVHDIGLVCIAIHADGLILAWLGKYPRLVWNIRGNDV